MSNIEQISLYLFSIPLFSIVKSKYSSDSRMLNLLKLVGAEDRAVSLDNEIIKIKPMDYEIVSEKLELFRTESEAFLKTSIDELSTYSN